MPCKVEPLSRGTIAEATSHGYSTEMLMQIDRLCRLMQFNLDRQVANSNVFTSWNRLNKRVVVTVKANVNQRQSEERLRYYLADKFPKRILNAIDIQVVKE